MTLADVFRQAVGPDLPFSFSAGIDSKNFAADRRLLASVPVTTCSDLLKTRRLRPPPRIYGIAFKSDEGTRRKPPSMTSSSNPPTAPMATSPPPPRPISPPPPRKRATIRATAPPPIAKSLRASSRTCAPSTASPAKSASPSAPTPPIFSTPPKLSPSITTTSSSPRMAPSARPDREILHRKRHADRQLRRLLQRVRQLRHLLPRVRRAIHRKTQLPRHRRIPQSRRPARWVLHLKNRRPRADHRSFQTIELHAHPPQQQIHLRRRLTLHRILFRAQTVARA